MHGRSAMGTRLGMGLGCLLVMSAALSAAPERPARPKDWLALRSPGFYVVGNAGERGLRRVAERLERFRETFALLFPKTVRAASRPITVVVFRNHKAFEPFKPLYGGKPAEHVAGFYLGGRANDYVALTTEGAFDYGIVYHEYVHVLLNAVATAVPVWFAEGLAEYYRTFELVGQRQANLGQVVEGHIWLLREQWMPLATLLAVGHDSPYYNEGNKASLFYAESWALVHYLMLGEGQKYAKRVARFLGELAQGAAPEDASLRALGVPLNVLERDVRRYIEQGVFPRQTATFAERLSDLGRLPVEPLPEADAHATLADLLAQMGRGEAARAQLDAALALDPDHAQAHASIGRLLFGEGKRDEALGHLERAVKGAGANWLTHYLYASALQESRGSTAASPADGAIETALRTVVRLNPDFAEGYAQLAWLEMARPVPRDAEVDALVREALERAPGEDRYVYLQASVLMQRRRHDEARPLLLRLKASRDPWLRRVSRETLARIDRGQGPGTAGAPPGALSAAGTDSPATGSTFIPVFREPEADEQRLAGILTAIECGEGGIALVVTVKGRTSRVRVVRFEDVDFITYRTDLEGKVSCGPRGTPEPVIVSYRPEPEGGSGPGDAVAVEFLPDGYELPP